MRTRPETVGLSSVLFAVALVLYGCRGGLTVTPRTVRDNVASIGVSGTANGGWLGYWTNAAGVTYSVIDADARARYNELIAEGWGTNIRPRLVTQDAGVEPFTNGTFLINLMHDEAMGLMNQRRKATP